MALSVAIMGAGRMAQGFDAPGDAHVLSLAHAVMRTQGLALAAFYDLVPGRAAEAEARWSVGASPRQRDVWLDQGWDIICIATPDAQHGADLADVLARKPRAVIVEKPLSVDPDEADRLLDQARQADVPVIVDYPRRFHSGIARVAGMIARDALGQPLVVTCAHSGSLAHAAVHMLDVLHGWWDRDWEVALAGRTGQTSLLTLTADGVSVALQASQLVDDPYYLWDLRVTCQKGEIALTRSPEVLQVSLPAPHPLYPDFAVLTPAQSFDMEGEPLLLRLMDTVAALAGDSAQAREQLALETRRQHFIGRVLRHLAPETGAASTYGLAS